MKDNKITSFAKINNNYKQLSSSQKKGAGTPAYTRFVNRWFGRILASVFAAFNINPNTISFFSSAITLISFILFLIFPFITFWHSLLLVILLFFGYALDSADGQVARLIKRQSTQGEWLDHTLDAIKIPLSHTVAVFYLVTNIESVNKIMIIFYIFIISFASANFLAGILKSKLLIITNQSRTNTNSEKSSIVRSLITLPLDYGFFVFLFIFTYDVDVFELVYNIWGVVFIIYSILLFVKSWKELTSIKN